MLDHDYLKYFTISSNSILVDLGATLGEFGQMALPQLRQTNSTLYCVEPSLWNIKHLAEWINKEAHENVVLLGCGIWDANTSLKLSVSTNYVLHHVEGLENNFGSEEVRKDIMPVVSLDTLIEIAGGRIDYLKADIEGAELEVFLNCKNIKAIENFAIASYHIRDGEKTVYKLQKFFEEKGFTTRHENLGFNGFAPHDMLYCTLEK